MSQQCVSYSRDVLIHNSSEDFHPLCHHHVIDQLERQRVLQSNNDIPVLISTVEVNPTKYISLNVLINVSANIYSR